MTVGTPAEKVQILFICNQNSARSQMAEGLMRIMFGDKYEPHSAGVQPKDEINPYYLSTTLRLA